MTDLKIEIWEPFKMEMWPERKEIEEPMIDEDPGDEPMDAWRGGAIC